MNLCAADIGAEWAVDLASNVLAAGFADLASVCATLLCIGVFTCHLRKGSIEYGNIVLHPKADIGILVQRTVAGCLTIRCAKRDRLIAILVVEPYPAVIVVMPDVATPEDDKARLDLLFVEDETHAMIPTVQKLCRSAA